MNHSQVRSTNEHTTHNTQHKTQLFVFQNNVFEQNKTNSYFSLSPYFDISLSLKGPDKFAFVPRTTKSTKEECLELFGLFLDFIGKHSQQFDLWIRVLKHQFLTTLYPNIAKQLGWIDKNDSTILLHLFLFFLF
jgi:hypothetical protein